MERIIVELHDKLNQFKDFEAGYKSSNENEMIVKFKDENYLVEMKKIGRGNVWDHMKGL